MGKYQSYKFSGIEMIGEIPTNWILNSIKHLVDIKITDGPHLTPVFVDEGGVPFLSVESIQNSKIDFKKRRGDISFEDHKEFSKKCKPQIDDILLVKSGSVGKLTIVEVTDEFNIWSPLSLIRINDKGNPKFYFYLFHTDYFQIILKLNSGINTQPNIGMGVIENLKVVSPPIIEQLQIVKFLDEKTELIDKLISTKERKITLLKEQRISLINQVVTKGLNPNIKMKDTGVEWIGEIPEHWEIKRTSYLCTDMMSGPFGSSLKKEFYTKSGYKIYGQEQVIDDDFSIGDYYISEEKFNELKRCEIFTNEILISCVGTFGKISLVPKEFERGIINPRLLKISPNELLINPKYFLILLRSNISFSQFECYSRGGTMGVINLEILKQLKFSIPPIKEQVEIIQYIEIRTKEIDDLVHLEQKKIDLLKEYRQSLISEVVFGKLKVTTDE